MSKYCLLLLLGLLSVVSASAVDIHLAGDSTMAAYDGKRGRMTGWGEVLLEFCSDGVNVRNHAKSGFTMERFRKGKYWQTLLDGVKPGDFVIIQFGHNDQKAAKDPKIGPKKSLQLYRRNLTLFLDDVRQKGGNAIVVTSIVRCTFDKEGKLIDGSKLRLYCEEALAVAKEAGVPAIDLNSIAVKQLEAKSMEEAEKSYMVSVDGRDRTHLTDSGARQYAAWVVEAAKEANLPLGGCFR